VGSITALSVSRLGPTECQSVGRLKNNELKWIQKESHGRIDVLSWNLPGDTEKNYETLSQDYRCPGRDWNRAPPGYETRVLLLCKPVGAGPPCCGLCGYAGNIPN
jgi:hypothetical protein